MFCCSAGLGFSPVRLLIKSPPSKTITTALKSVTYTQQKITDILNDCIINCSSNTTQLVAQTDKDKNNVATWEHLMVLLQQGVSDHEATLILNSCFFRLRDIDPSVWITNKIGISVIRVARYIADYYIVTIPSMAYINPVMLNKMISI